MYANVTMHSPTKILFQSSYKKSATLSKHKLNAPTIPARAEIHYCRICPMRLQLK
jgi:hypothetical protein